jgi:hypothetical protein
MRGSEVRLTVSNPPSCENWAHAASSRALASALHAAIRRAHRMGIFMGLPHAIERHAGRGLCFARGGSSVKPTGAADGRVDRG